MKKAGKLNGPDTARRRGDWDHRFVDIPIRTSSIVPHHLSQEKNNPNLQIMQLHPSACRIRRSKVRQMSDSKTQTRSEHLPADWDQTQSERALKIHLGRPPYGTTGDKSTVMREPNCTIRKPKVCKIEEGCRSALDNGENQMFHALLRQKLMVTKTTVPLFPLVENVQRSS
jgi:hypothetical protein